MTSHNRARARVTGPVLAAAIITHYWELAALAILVGAAEELHHRQAEEETRRPARQHQRRQERLLQPQP